MHTIFVIASFPHKNSPSFCAYPGSAKSGSITKIFIQEKAKFNKPSVCVLGWVGSCPYGEKKDKIILFKFLYAGRLCVGRVETNARSE